MPKVVMGGFPLQLTSLEVIGEGSSLPVKLTG